MTINTNFIGEARRIDDIDLPKIGHMIGVGEDEIHAVLDVESTGSGFDSKGRPKMLFEPHIFYRNLSGSQRDAAVAAGLAYPKWRRNYPADSYPRLIQAIAINYEAALKSCSWGMGQIMGFNYKAAGYPTVEKMVQYFMQDEEFHLTGMINFIKYNNLDTALRNHDWATFAKGYNGSGYKANRYDTRLAARYAFWQTKVDTPWNPNDAEEETASEPPTGNLTLIQFIIQIILNLFKGK